MQSKTTPNKKRKFFLKISAVFILFCSFFIITTQFPAQASAKVQTITKIKEVARFKLRRAHSQGATLTKKYYIYTDWSSNDGYTDLVYCDRQTKKCTRKTAKQRHASSIHHKWGTNYFLVLNSGGSPRWCWSISPKKKLSSTEKCEKISPSNLRYSGVDQYYSQGYTKYGNYYLRGFGHNYSNYIGLFNKNKKRIKIYKLPKYIREIEDVMVDGDTGIVYFTTVQGASNQSVAYYKVDKKYFNEWIKPIGSSDNQNNNDNGSASGNKSGGTPSEKYTQPESPGYDGTVNTTLFGTIKDDGEGCGTYEILNLIIQILTIGIGITATIGIVVEGIRYLTSKDNVAQATKAKRRIFDIFVGLAIYAVLWTLLSFLLPGGTLNTSTTCERVDSATTSTKFNKNNTKDTDNNTDNITPSANNEESTTDNKTASEKLNAKAIELAWKPGNRQKSKKSATAAFTKAMNATGTNKGETNSCRKKGKACGMYVGTVVRAAGINSSFPKSAASIYNFVKKSSKWKEVSNSSAKAGDIQLYFKKGKSSASHVSMVVKYNGKLVTAQASLCDFYGRIENSIKSYGKYSKKTFRYIGS